MPKPLDSLQFDNTYAQLPESFYQVVFPTPLQDLRVVAFSRRCAELIDLDPSESTKPEFAARLGGALPLPGSWPIAQVYAGHQFGNLVPRLGDGRAILLGEACGSRAHVWNRYRGLSGRKWDLHLKGAGPTMFSRGFDGRAVLRSCIREYLASESLETLGIPTTRALAVLGSRDPVFRETPEPGAMVVRLAPSHIRFGTFEYFYYQQQYHQLKELADFTLSHYFPDQEKMEAPYAELCREVVIRTAQLIAHWQAFGFTHGVMNTDNFSILGLTLDYGPYGFVESYDPGFVSNHSDEQGMYAFGNQPQIGWFNLQCLVRALSPLLKREQAQAALEEYEPAMAACYLGLMADKLGFLKRREEDERLIGMLLEVLPGTDYSLFFRRLASFDATQPAIDLSFLNGICGSPERLRPWLQSYQRRILDENLDPAQRRAHMNRVNPKFVLRNHLAQIAIERAEGGDDTEVQHLSEILSRPFDEQPENENYSLPAPPGSKPCVISCSS